MTIAERNNKLKHFITCLKCEVSGKSCDVNCSIQYDAGTMGEIIENLEVILKVLEQESTTKNDLEVGCISRISALDSINWAYNLSDAYQKINDLPSVTPQEPFINKPCVSSGVCEHDKQKVLEKIRAEIQELPIQFTCAREMQKWSLEIIDKYKSEIEPQESED